MDNPGYPSFTLLSRRSVADRDSWSTRCLSTGRPTKTVTVAHQLHLSRLTELAVIGFANGR